MMIAHSLIQIEEDTGLYHIRLLAILLFW